MQEQIIYMFSMQIPKVNCKNCKCPLFNYVPIHGSMDLKCSCHHSFEDHDPVTKKCTKGCSCKKFSSNYTCDCGLPYDQHHTEIETREERIKLGKNVDAGNNMVAGLGFFFFFWCVFVFFRGEKKKFFLKGMG